MDCSQYQALAARTECTQIHSQCRMAAMDYSGAFKLENSHPSLTPIRVNHSIIGICGEVGEIQELFVLGRYKDNVQIILELGDVLWYMVESCNALGVNMQEIYNNRTGMFEYAYLEIPARMSVIAGKLCSELQRWIYYGKYEAEDKRHVLKENLITLYKQLMGYCTLIMSYMNVTISTVMEANIQKLKVRYPDKYTDFHAADENRDRKAEEAHISTDTPT